MANKIEGELVIRGADKASRDLKGVGDSAAKSADQIDDLGKDAKSAAKGVDTLGDQAKDSSKSLGDMADKTGFLDSEVTRLEGHLKGLIKQLNETGDTSLLKDIRKDKRQLGMFAKLAKEIAPEAGKAGAETGASFGTGMISAATAVAKSGGPYVMGALAAAAVAVAPFIGATIGAAVLGGAGAGGIIGGITLAAQDPRVKAAAEGIGAEMLHSLEPIGASFVDPVIDSLDLFGRAVADIADKAGPGLADLAAEVEPLARGIAGLAENAMPGFLKALEASKPILRILADQLPQIGDAVSDMFESISEGGDGAAMALDFLLDGVKGGIITFGWLVKVLSQTYEAMVDVGLAIGDAADDAAGWFKVLNPLLYPLGALNNLLDDQVNALDAAGEGADISRAHYRDFAAEAEAAAEEVRGLTDAVSDYLGIQMSADEAALAWASGMRELKEELRDGKRTLDANTEAGEANVQGLLRQIAVAGDVRASAIAQGDGTKEAMDKANEAYKGNIQLIYDAAKAAGFNKAELDKMFAPYLNGPRQAVTEFLFPGLIAGLERARELSRLLGSKVAVANADRGEYGGGRAAGGPTVDGRTYLVGEHGPELRSDLGNGYITNAAQTKALLSGNSGGAAAAGGLDVRVSWTGPGGAAGDIGQALMRFLHIEIMGQGGNVQQVLGSG